MGMLILAGNTLYPCFLRFIIWILRLMMPNNPSWQSWRVTLDFILDHPRRVYTNLFPARHTWYLLGTIIILNGIDWAAFELLSIGNQEIEALPSEYRILDGLFQAFAVRAGGFYVVTIADLRQGLLVLYVLMMYVSAYPVLVTMRNTNVYEERSLGIYANDESPNSPNQPARGNVLMDIIRHHVGRPTLSECSRSYFVHQQLRSQLSHDIWWIALAVLFIAIAESDHYKEQPVAFSTFNLVFEVVSAYGCVGVSVGYPGKNYSFCGAWHTISKLILAAVALRGRHRGLPVAIDKAIMLPSESLAWAEEEDAALRRDRAGAWHQDRMPAGSV
jgi:potassium uptake Trk family protein